MLDDVDSDQEIAVGLLLIIVLWYSCYSVSLHKTIVTVFTVLLWGRRLRAFVDLHYWSKSLYV